MATNEEKNEMLVMVLSDFGRHLQKAIGKFGCPRNICASEQVNSSRDSIHSCHIVAKAPRGSIFKA